MSMNLVFYKGKQHLGFPFQTPTSLTYEVLAKKTADERLALIKEYLMTTCNSGHPDDVDRLTKMIKQIDRNLRNPALELTYQ